MKNRTLQKQLLQSGAVLAGTAVALGAFGAHTLKEIILPADLAMFETGVRYQFYHALALIVLSALIRRLHEKPLKQVFRFMLAGVVLFSGSLYLLSVREMAFGYNNDFSWIGTLTPLGGMLLIAAWAILAYKGYKANDGTESEVATRKRRREIQTDTTLEKTAGIS